MKTAKQIIESVLSRHPKVDYTMITMQYGKRTGARSVDVTRCRDECCYEIRRQIGYSNERIARVLNRHNSSISVAIARHKSRIDN